MPYWVKRVYSKNSYTGFIDEVHPDTGEHVRLSKTWKNVAKLEAEQLTALWYADVMRGTYVKPSKLTLAEYLETWLAERCVPRLAPKTIEGYRICVYKHIVPSIGEMKLSALKPLHLQSLYSRLLAQGLSKRTVEYVHAVLHASLKQAVKWQVLERNPAEATEPPRPQRQEAESLSQEQVQPFLQAVKDIQPSLYELVFVALTTGLRRGELLALRWEDVDFEHDMLRVRRSLVKIKGEIINKTPKSGKGRSVPLIEDVSRLLKELRLRTPHELVFCYRDGAPLDPSTVTHQFLQIVRKAGYGNLTFHGLRHSFATILLENDTNLKVTQELLGHSNEAITANIYSHVKPTLIKDAQGTLERAFAQGLHKVLRKTASDTKKK